SDGLSTFCGIVLLIATILEISILVNITRNWRALRKDVTAEAVDISMLIRVMLFGAWTFLGLVYVLLSSLFNPDLWLASIGLVEALIFGTQKSVFVALFSWVTQRKEHPEEKIDSYTVDSCYMHDGSYHGRYSASMARTTQTGEAVSTRELDSATPRVRTIILMDNKSILFMNLPTHHDYLP
ncbi:17389_t:CDS:2, partial [Acaulospora colombiana]